MTLADARLGHPVRIAHADGDAGAGLGAVGLHAGEEAVVERAAPFGGPLLVAIAHSGVRVAVGRRLAGKIAVEPIHAKPRRRRG